MNRKERYSRLVREAVQRVGSEAQLAALLGVPVARLHRWAEGEETPPFEAFLASLDFVAHGAFASPIRVAVLDQRDTAQRPEPDPSSPGLSDGHH